MFGKLIINNIDYDNWNEYMPNSYKRFLNLLKIIDYSDVLITIFSTPLSRDLKQIFPMYTFLDFSSFELENSNVQKQIDLCFLERLQIIENK